MATNNTTDGLAALTIAEKVLKAAMTLYNSVKSLTEDFTSNVSAAKTAAQTATAAATVAATAAAKEASSQVLAEVRAYSASAVQASSASSEALAGAIQAQGAAAAYRDQASWVASAVEDRADQVVAVGDAVATASAAAQAARTEVATTATKLLANPKTVSSATYTLTPDDYNSSLRFTAATAVTLSLPASAPAGTFIHIIQAGTGAVTCAAGSGATVEGDALGRKATYGRRSTATAWVDTNSNGTSAVWFVAGFLM